MKSFVQSFGARSKKDAKENVAIKSRNTSSSSSSSSSNSGGGGAKAGKAQPRQMFLDFGQKSFGKNNECPICGMFYVLGDVDDEMRHTQNCTKFRDGPLLSSFKGLKVVAEVEDKRGGKGSVLEVRQTQSKGASQPSFPESIQNVLSVVRRELGSSDDDQYTGREVAYLYVLNSKMVVGCLIAEEITPSQHQLASLSADISSTDAVVSYHDQTSAVHSSASSGQTRTRLADVGATHEGSSSATSEPFPREDSFIDHPHKKSRIVHDPKDAQVGFNPVVAAACRTEERLLLRLLLGVRSVWVHSGHRRLHVARTILDAARKHLLFGSVVLRSDVAFAQPTDEGLKFALGYTQQPAVWGYV